MLLLLRILTVGATWALIFVWLDAPWWPKVLLYPVLVPAMYYAATPVITALRLWRYLSAYLLVYQAVPGAPLALHLGTSYDLIWRLLPRRRRGERNLRALHREIYRGLARFRDEVRSGKVPESAVVTTCSYFLTPPQMARFGFTEMKAPLLTRLNFWLAYPEVLFQQWLLSGRLRFFHPNRVRFFRTTAGELAAHCEALRAED